MTPPRTQQHRHWVQVEYAPTGTERRVLHLDLNMVDEVVAVLGINPDDPDDKQYANGVRIHYAGVMKPIDLENRGSFTGPSAAWFYKLWLEFIELRAQQAPAPTSLIHRPDSTNQFSR